MFSRLKADPEIVCRAFGNTRSSGKGTTKARTPGRPKTTSSKNNTTNPEHWHMLKRPRNAKDLLEIYFTKIGGRPDEVKQPKKRGRKSLVDADSAKKARTEARESGSGRGRRKSEKQEVNSISPARASDEWKPPKPGRGTWEDLVVAVETIEAEGDEKWAFLRWAIEDEEGNQRRTKARLSTVYLACPQAMLRFYEAHL